MRNDTFLVFKDNRPVFLLGLTIALLFGIGNLLLADAFRMGGNIAFQALAPIPLHATAAMLVTCSLTAWIAWRTDWFERLSRLSYGPLLTIAAAIVVIPYLTNHFNFALLGTSRPSWQLWFLREDAMPYFEASQLAIVVFIVLSAKLIASINSSDLPDGQLSSLSLEDLIRLCFSVGGGCAVWTGILWHLGKHSLATIVGMAVAYIFWIRHSQQTSRERRLWLSFISPAIGFFVGALFPLIWSFFTNHAEILLIGAFAALLFELLTRQSDGRLGWRDILASLGFGALGVAFGLAIGTVVSVFQILTETIYDIAVNGAAIPYGWEKYLTSAGALVQDRFHWGFVASQVRSSLAMSEVIGPSSIAKLPHAWDDFMLQVTLIKHGWLAGIPIVLLLLTFLSLTFKGIQHLDRPLLRLVGMMLWSFLALSTLINLQANLGLLPGIPFLGLPFLSYHFFLAALGGLLAGLAMKGFSQPRISTQA